MKLQFGVAASVAVFAASLSVAPASAADVEPTFRVESAALEVGPVTAGTVAVATFVFHNDGASEVRILRAAPS